MKTILVPTDYSKNADHACKYAIELAKEFGAKIILMHTFETPVIYSDGMMMTAQLDYSVIYNSESKKLKTYFNKINQAADEVKIELVLQQGLASSRIAETALEKKADLIVIGTTGKGALERMLIGSTASRVIQKASCMVLAVPPNARFEGLKKIVYATDLSEENLDHAQTLVPLAKKFNSEILFLNVNRDLFIDEDEHLKKMKKIREHIRYAKISAYLCHDSDIDKGIDFFLKKHKVNCIAFYTHHVTIFQNLFGKSITKKMSVHTSVPLLSIHEKD